MPFSSSEGVRIHYQVVGDGPPLVLHHGFTESLESWHRKGFVAALRPHRRLILVDARGHGKSDKPHSPDAYSLRHNALDIASALDALAIDRADYCGYSLGGWAGFGLAKYAQSRVRSLILGGAQPYGQSLAIYREMLAEDMETCLLHLERAAGGVLPAPLREAFLQNDVEALRAAYTNDRPDISEVLPTIHVPCLLFSGSEDPLCRPIERCAATLPDAEFFLVPHLNHVQTGLQLRQVLPRVKEFLSKVDAG